MKYFMVSFTLSLIIVFIFRKQLRSRRDAMLRNIKGIFVKNDQK